VQKGIVEKKAFAGGDVLGRNIVILIQDDGYPRKGLFMPFPGTETKKFAFLPQ
jgi:hypothetical protein